MVLSVLIKYPTQTKEGNKIFFEKKDQELTHLDWAKWAGWFDTDGTFVALRQKVASLKLTDRQPVELFANTFETSLTDYSSKSITPAGTKYKITIHQALVREEKAIWFTKNVYPYLIKEEKKDYAVKLLGYRPTSKDFADWTPDEVTYYLATALEGDGSYFHNEKRKNYIQVRLYSSDVQYLSDVRTLVNDKLGELFSGISEGPVHKTKRGDRHVYRANGYASLTRNLDLMRNLIKNGTMTLDRKKQKVQDFLNQ